MQKWDYKRVEAKWDKKAKCWTVEERYGDVWYFNNLGQQGWEMVSHFDGSVFDQWGNVKNDWCSYLFKRPVE